MSDAVARPTPAPGRPHCSGCTHRKDGDRFAVACGYPHERAAGVVDLSFTGVSGRVMTIGSAARLCPHFSRAV